MDAIPKTRLEAFSDGVLAIIITIMVLELHAPHGADLAALRPVLPAFLSYALSFLYVGIYWNNHHHLLHATKRINGRIMWANLHLLFWLSLIPFGTRWLGENHGGAGQLMRCMYVLRSSGSSPTAAWNVWPSRANRYAIMRQADLPPQGGVMTRAVRLVLPLAVAVLTQTLASGCAQKTTGNPTTAQEVLKAAEALPSDPAKFEYLAAQLRQFIDRDQVSEAAALRPQVLRLMGSAPAGYDKEELQLVLLEVAERAAAGE